MDESRAVMDLAVMAGSILIESGAEISRVEETVKRICRAYGAEQSESYVLTNGIFTTASLHGGETYARVRFLPSNSTRLDRIAAVNQLSREIAAGERDVASATQILREIQRMPGPKPLAQLGAAGIGAASFCHLFAGGLSDCACAAVCGVALQGFLLLVRGRLGKLSVNLMGGALVTLLCLLMRSAGLGAQINQMIIGSIVPLVPGVSFTNAIRDIAEGNYLSGAVRMLDALLVGFCMAVGVMAAYTLWRWMGGVVQ